jgi:hypothetical protein
VKAQYFTTNATDEQYALPHSSYIPDQCPPVNAYNSLAYLFRLQRRSARTYTHIAALSLLRRNTNVNKFQVLLPFSPILSLFYFLSATSSSSVDPHAFFTFVFPFA